MPCCARRARVRGLTQGETVRYNPPPTWPTAPEGWQPPPGWEPDPSWPAAPEGWQLWVEDEDEDGAEEAALAAAHRAQAVKTFWIGVGVFVAGAISTIVASGSSGGIIWYGGMIFGAILLFRAVTAYRASRSAGGAALGAQGKGLAVAGVVACLVVGGVAVSMWAESESLEPTAGSCWKVDGEQAVLIGCSHAHDFRAVQVVKDEAQCPQTAVGWVEGDGTDLVCLAED